MNYSRGKFGDCTFSRLSFIVRTKTQTDGRTDRRTHRQTLLNALLPRRVIISVVCLLTICSYYIRERTRDTLRIFTSTLYGKTKTNTNPDPNRYKRRCPDPNAMIQKKELQIKTKEDGNFKAGKIQN